jgi:solute carrier family 25 (adenine nucleotide translocator) protein 4/5/6/31
MYCKYYLLCPSSEQLQHSIQGPLHTNTNQSAWFIARTIYEQEGFFAFWRGNWPSCLRLSATAALNFTLMDYYKQVAVALAAPATQQHTDQRRQRIITSFVSGGLAGATSTTLLYPFEFVRTRLAMDTGSTQQRQYQNGMMQVIRTISRVDGISGFYQGYGIALVGSVLYRIMFLGGYEALKGEVVLHKQQQQHHDESGLSDLTWGERMTIAQTVSLTAGTMAYPIDSVRRRLMMQAGLPQTERRYRNSLVCFQTIFRQEGLRGFYLGIGPNMVRSSSGALLLVGYDVMKSVLW